MSGLTGVLCLVVLLGVAALTLQGCGGSITRGSDGSSHSRNLWAFPWEVTTTTTTTTHFPVGSDCLCVFDIDRTLTGKQWTSHMRGAPSYCPIATDCPINAIQPGVTDVAYGGGTLILSDFIQHVDRTFCAACYMGLVSGGSGSGPDEHVILHEKLSIGPGKQLLQNKWSTGCTNVTSPLVINCFSESKSVAVDGIVNWFWHSHKIGFNATNVHFFDDSADNVKPFQTLTKYNARQIACAKRDHRGAIGLCGATVGEIVQDRGVKLCSADGDAVSV